MCSGFCLRERNGRSYQKQVSAIPDLPRPLPAWVREGVLVELLRALAEDLMARGDLDLAETFIDASFSGGKRGAVRLVQHAAAKGPRSWQLRTAMVFLSPWGLQALRRMKLASSKPPSNSASRAAPQRMIGDRAYDSDPLDAKLQQQGIQPDRSAQVQPPQTAYPGRPRVAPLLPPLENRASVCLVA